MKKIIFCLLSVLLVFTACDSVEDDTKPGGAITVEQLKSMSSVTVDQENGQNINHVRVTSSAPCTVVWSNGVLNTPKPTTDFTMLVTGDQTITLTAMNADGSIITADFPVHIDAISPNYPVDPTYGLLCGSGEKSWTWYEGEDGHVWGNCGWKDSDGHDKLNGGTWWGCPASDMEEQAKGQGAAAGDGEGATMTFSLNGLTITKSNGGKGTFSFDMNNKITTDQGATWSYGSFTTTGDGILMPYYINGFGKCESYDILYLDENYLVLGGHEPHQDWNEVTYWRFKAVK